MVLAYGVSFKYINAGCNRNVLNTYIQSKTLMQTLIDKLLYNNSILFYRV